MTLSNGTARFAQANDKVSELSKDLAMAFMDFPGEYGYAPNGEFGTLKHLKERGHSRILTISRVELIKVN